MHLRYLGYLLACGLLCITLIGCNSSSNQLASTPVASTDFLQSWKWKKLGVGILDVFHTTDGIILYPEPINAIGLKGNSGKELSLGTSAYYIRTADEQFSNPEMIEVMAKPFAFGMGFTVKDQLFPADGISKKMSSGELNGVLGDETNLWLASEDGSSLKPILSTEGYDELNEKVKTDEENTGENKYMLNWSSDPHPMSDGVKLAFISNRKGILTKQRGQSIYIVNKDGSEERLLLDSAKYGNMTIIGTAKDLIAADNDKDALMIVNVSSGEVREYSINGMSIAISPNGETVLFRKVKDATVQKDLWLLDVESGKETIVTDFPPDYFFNTEGEWSPDGARYAFYGNGLEVTDKTKGYRDNNILLVIETASASITSYGKPEGTASIYPLGTNHWIDAEHVLVYLDDDTAWIAKVK